MQTRHELRDSRKLRSRRIKAILAAGAVFGIGFSATFASWTDTEVATSTVSSGMFSIWGTAHPTNNDFAEHSTTPATLSFSTPAGAMFPGNTVYSSYRVQTTPGSGSGTISVAAPSVATPNSFSSALRYQVGTVSAASQCSSTGPVTVLSAFRALNVIPVTHSISLNANASTTAILCLALQLDTGAANDAQGKSAALTWTVNGVSS